MSTFALSKRKCMLRLHILCSKTYKAMLRTILIEVIFQTLVLKLQAAVVYVVVPCDKKQHKIKIYLSTLAVWRRVSTNAP